MPSLDDYKDIRQTSYDHTDVFLVCFDLTSAASLDNACHKWKVELLNLGPKGVPKVLVGCKKDLRD